MTKPLPKKVRIDRDGTIHAPPGEMFLMCGECRCSSWFLFVQNVDRAGLVSPIARAKCRRCGNELTFTTDQREGSKPKSVDDVPVT